MTIRDAVAEGVRRLGEIADTPFLDAVLLLEEATGLTKERVFVSYPDELTGMAQDLYQGFIEQRVSGTPISYITRVKEFYSLSYMVDPRVLAPRPDTEILVDAALSLCESLPGNPSVHDCCTGSGCVAITLKHELPRLEVSASDLSNDALDVFAANSGDILGATLPFVQSDLLDAVEGTYDLITANPPYLTSAQVGRMKADGWLEPLMALDGGDDGLALYQRLIPDAARQLTADGFVLLEADPDQMGALGKMLQQNAFRNVIIHKDLGGRDRVIQGQR
jgi:release factor glutamine methyltransferase